LGRYRIGRLEPQKLGLGGVIKPSLRNALPNSPG
jgi:hypothetical protein